MGLAKKQLSGTFYGGGNWGDQHGVLARVCSTETYKGSGNSAAQEATMKKDLGSVVNRGHTVRGG